MSAPLCAGAVDAMLGAVIMSPEFEISSRVVGEVLDGEAVLLDLASGKYFSLNRSATRMWELLAERRGVEQVVAQVLNEFSADEATVRADLAALIADLLAKGILIERR